MNAILAQKKLDEETTRSSKDLKKIVEEKNKLEKEKEKIKEENSKLKKEKKEIDDQIAKLLSEKSELMFSYDGQKLFSVNAVLNHFIFVSRSSQQHCPRRNVRPCTKIRSHHSSI